MYEVFKLYRSASHPQLTHVEGLESFLALGIVRLGNNSLTLAALQRLRDTHILQLTLLGNPVAGYAHCTLCRFSSYHNSHSDRHHVVDMLSGLWMLDGRLITGFNHHTAM